MKGSEAPPSARAKALLGLGYLASVQGDQERGRTSLGEALALYRELEDKKGIGESLCELGLMEMWRGDDERAKAFLEEGLAVTRESGDEWTIGYALNRRALSAHDEGDLEEANALWEEALRLYRKLGDTERIRSVLFNMGYAECVLGNHERAEALAGEVLALNREMNVDPSTEALGLLVLGIAKMQGGELERAGALVEESLVLHRELGLSRDVAECLEVMAGVAGGLGEDRRAARLWGAAGALRQATDNPWLLFERRLHEPYLIAARSRMEEAKWTDAWEEGWVMTLEDAIAYALEEEEASG